MTREDFEAIDLNNANDYNSQPSLALPPKFMKHRRGELRAVVDAAHQAALEDAADQAELENGSASGEIMDQEVDDDDLDEADAVLGLKSKKDKPL